VEPAQKVLAHTVKDVHAMYHWAIYREDEDTGLRTYLGTVAASSMAEALQLAAEYYEIDNAELVAVRTHTA
jgi:hypothetical protein